MTLELKAPAISSRGVRAQTTDLLGKSLLAAVLVGFLYYRVIGKLAVDWAQIQDYSHGFVVPPFAAYLLWKKRDAIAATTIVPTWVGVSVIAFGLVALLAGIYGAELFLSRVSLVILFTGFALAFGGWKVLRLAAPSILVLLLCIPIPDILFVHITLPLQMFASQAASFLLPLVRVPVLREGNILVLPSLSLEVAEACSGIRSLISLMTLAILYAYFRKRSTFQGALLALASIPIAIAANALRLLGTGICVEYWDPEKAVGFFHEFSGWVVFLFSLALLVFVDRAITILPSRRKLA